MQHSNGTFQLIVWDERVTGEDRVAVRFGAPHPSVRIYDPTSGEEPVKTLAHTTTLDLTLGDHPLIVTLPPE